tara:strand:+ start:595 stop:1407 length:813 start_codon:yes stop_codon:yes gene_type:complete
MIGLILGETKLGNLIIKKLELLKVKFIIIDISKRKIFKKNINSFVLSVGQLGKAISILKKNKCEKLIFAGRISRPNFAKIKFDLKALYYLPKIIKSSKKGDALLLKMIIKIFNKEGFKTLDSMHFNPELVLKKGICTKTKPTNLNKTDIYKGKSIVTDLKEHNVGQAVVVRSGYVIAIEGNDGTDAMLNRAFNIIKTLNLKKRKEGILLKFPKKNQDSRIDLPTIGIKTIKKCEKIGLKGIVLKAKKNIFLDRQKCINLANKNKMFIAAI